MTTMTPFDDLLAANREYAATNDILGFDGIAHAGVAVVTCMDSRIDPLGMLGLKPGAPANEVKRAFRGNALEALVLAVHLLNVDRILIVPHTRCAMASSTEQELRDRISASAGTSAAWQGFHVVRDQHEALRQDVAAVRSHPLISGRADVGGFVYDVDTGLLATLD